MFYFVEYLSINEWNLNSYLCKNNWNIKRSNPENKYMFKVNSTSTRTRCHIFKANTNDSREMISFYSGVDTVPWHRFQASIYLFKVNNVYTRIKFEICSKLTIKSTECRRLVVFIGNFEHVSLLILVFLLLTLGMCLFDRLDEYNTA